MSNRLEQEKSPYLLQHKDNPVDWYPWCREAFQKAAKEDKPIFLSIGYSTCHWCHVMAHESFEQADIAAILNRDFVCIKVDREERPDIDAVYMAVCQALTGSGGWPLTILMTPEQKPFFAGTYFPRTVRYGQMGLTELLEQTAYLWRTQRANLLEAGDQITAVMQRHGKTNGTASAQNGSGMVPDRMLLQEAYRLLRQSFDPAWGGFGAPPKFPIPHNLLFLLRISRLEEEPEALSMAEATLRAMAQGGIFDQIGGGFSRYSTDERWLVPHFEKMLYDNALLILAYLEAFQLTGKECYGETARQTADYILAELSAPEGGFCCGQDADSDGVEGKYYVFTPEEVIQVLGQERGSDFCRRYHITAEGNFEGKSIPNRIGQLEENRKTDDLQRDGRYGEDKRKLYEYRRSRTHLHRDDKVLLSWNGWAILALAKAGLILEDNRYLEAAVRTQQFIEKRMTDERDRLYLRFREGEAVNDGQLDDYAVYALALLELYRVTLDVRYLKLAILRAGQMRTFFEDGENGGFFMSAADAEQLIVRPKEVYDGAIPSGNAVAAMVLETLAGLTGETVWREAADRQHRFMAEQSEGYPAGHCFALLAMAQSLYPHRELICAGRDVPSQLTAYLRTRTAEDLSILFKSPENERLLAEAAPFTASYPIPEQGTVWYLCRNGACQAPVTEFEQLKW